MADSKLNPKLVEFTKNNPKDPSKKTDKSTRMVFLDRECDDLFSGYMEDNNLSKAEAMNKIVEYILDNADQSQIKGEPEYNIRHGVRLERFGELKQLIDEKKIKLSKVIRDALLGKL